MRDWPIGLSTGCFHDTSIFDCLDQIHQAGFSQLEICSVREHLDYHDLVTVKRAADRLHEAQLRPYSFHAPFGPDIDITSLDPQKREKGKEEILHAVDAAVILGVRHFVIHPGPEKGGYPKSERIGRMENAAEVLTAVTHYCRERGVQLVLENMLPHLFAGHVENLLYILGALKTTHVGVCLDTGHAHLAGDEPTIVQKLSGHLWMLHANDNNGSGDDHLPPGDGQIDWARLLTQLNHIQFGGTLILELDGRSDRRAVLDGAKRGRRHLLDIVQRLDAPV